MTKDHGGNSLQVMRRTLRRNEKKPVFSGPPRSLGLRSKPAKGVEREKKENK